MEKEVLSVTAECRLSPGFSVIKAEHVWQITYQGRKVYDISDIRDLFGGKKVPTECDADDTLVLQDAFVFRVGWKRDLVVAFGVIRDANNKAIGLQRLNFFPRDGRIYLHRLNPNQFGTQFGRKGDLKLRWCWDHHGGDLWWNSHDHRKGDFLACSTTDASYGSTQERIMF